MRSNANEWIGRFHRGTKISSERKEDLGVEKKKLSTKVKCREPHGEQRAGLVAPVEGGGSNVQCDLAKDYKKTRDIWECTRAGGGDQRPGFLKKRI